MKCLFALAHSTYTTRDMVLHSYSSLLCDIAGNSNLYRVVHFGMPLVTE